jgi:hypothetical protein
MTQTLNRFTGALVALVVANALWLATLAPNVA